MDVAGIAESLQDVHLFGALGEEERLELARRMRPKRFARGEVVFHRDDPALHLYVILAGTVKIVLPDESGREAVVALVRGGDVFGELALFDDSPRSATVTAINETLTLLLAREDFLHVLDRNPAAVRHMLKLLARMVRRLSGQVESLIFLDTPSRIAKCLLDLTEVEGLSTREVSLTQDDLAAFVGATRVSVNRVLADLQQRGLITVARRRVRVLDAERLREQIQYQ